MWHVWRRQMHTEFWWVSLKEKDHFEDLDIYGRIILKLVLKTDRRIWITFIWLVIGINGGLL
jgi:hypothetical protein